MVRKKSTAFDKKKAFFKAQNFQLPVTVVVQLIHAMRNYMSTLRVNIHSSEVMEPVSNTSKYMKDFLNAIKEEPGHPYIDHKGKLCSFVLR